MSDAMRKRFDEIERAIVESKMTKEQVFTQMKQAALEHAGRGAVDGSVIEACEKAIEEGAEIRGGSLSGVRKSQKLVREILEDSKPPAPVVESSDASSSQNCVLEKLEKAIQSLEKSKYEYTRRGFHGGYVSTGLYKTSNVDEVISLVKSMLNTSNEERE